MRVDNSYVERSAVQVVEVGHYRRFGYADDWAERHKVGWSHRDSADVGQPKRRPPTVRLLDCRRLIVFFAWEDSAFQHVWWRRDKGSRRLRARRGLCGRGRVHSTTLRCGSPARSASFTSTSTLHRRGCAGRGRGALAVRCTLACRVRRRVCFACRLNGGEIHRMALRGNSVLGNIVCGRLLHRRRIRLPSDPPGSFTIECFLAADASPIALLSRPSSIVACEMGCRSVLVTFETWRAWHNRD